MTLPEVHSDLLDPTCRSGRVIFFFRALESRADGDPSDGPFFDDPQPICSVAVDVLVPGTPISLDASCVCWPGGTQLLEGEYEVQAVFDSSTEERGHLAPGNLLSSVAKIDLSRETSDVVTLDFVTKIPVPDTPQLGNVEWIEMASPILSTALGRAIVHRAAVIFPRQYHDLKAKRRIWPTVYVVPGFGGRWTDAQAFARKLTLAGLCDLWPSAVYVILDPESALGHHGFVDSQANGPRGSALVTEFIPYLEERFRLIRDPAARVVTGHSSGGWSSVWLALNSPNVFGAAFASSPDPLDFSAFELCDLYKDTNLFVGEDGTERPSMRLVLGPRHELVSMLVRDEIGMERAISPLGLSGGQWDSWSAMFGPVVSGSAAPMRLCDPMTGVIDPVTVEAWSRFDIARRIRKDWNGWGRLFAERVRVVVGERDSFYLERAAMCLRDSIDQHARAVAAEGLSFPSGPGYIEVVPNATHDSVYPIAELRFNQEIREYFRRAGHHE